MDTVWLLLVMIIWLFILYVVEVLLEPWVTKLEWEKSLMSTWEEILTSMISFSSSVDLEELLSESWRKNVIITGKGNIVHGFICPEFLP